MVTNLHSLHSGFDFDLDEVWSPLNPHLKSVYNRGHVESASSAASSENSISTSRLAHNNEGRQAGRSPREGHGTENGRRGSNAGNGRRSDAREKVS